MSDLVLTVRTVGFRCQELEAGPYTFLLYDSVPIAYRDSSPEAERPGIYASTKKISKAHSRALNQWVKHRRYKPVSQDVIVTAFRGVSRFEPVEPPQPPPDKRVLQPIGRREADRKPVEAFVNKAIELFTNETKLANEPS